MKPSESSMFIAERTSSHATFSQLTGVYPADAEPGGFATLLRAVSPSGQVVAVKRYHGSCESEPELFASDREAALREYECMLDMDGANGHAPVVYALGTCIDRFGMTHAAIAMEFVEGFTLEQALRSGVLSGDRRTGSKSRVTLTVVRHVTQAVIACRPHVHRDLSPANVMLVMDGSGSVQRAVLIDFGQSAASTNPLVTPPNAPHKLATVCFGAPEVFSGPHYNRRNSERVDVYALGALLFYLRTRKLPYADAATQDPNTQQGMQAIMAAKAHPLDLLEELGPHVRPLERDMADFVARCTAFDPSARPSADEALALIDDMLASRSPQQAPDTGAATPAPVPASPVTQPWTAGTPNNAPQGSPATPPLHKTPGWKPNADTTPGNSTASTPVPENATASQLIGMAENSFYGHGVTRSVKNATKLLQRAAELGDASAQFKLGQSLMLHGDGDDREDGRRWLQKAADAGHRGAAVALGMF